MRILLDDREVLDAIRNGVRRDDGLLEIELPAHCLREADQRHCVLSFVAESRTVQYGRRSVRLSPREFALLSHLHLCGRTSFTELRSSIKWDKGEWSEGTSKGAIQKACSDLSLKFLEAEIPLTIDDHYEHAELKTLL